MAAHRAGSTQVKRTPVPIVKRLRTVTLMVGINEDHTSSAVIGVMHPDTKRYHFVRLADRPWWGQYDQAVAEALREAAMDVGLDEECLRLLR